MTRGDWSPAQYGRFAAERRQPFVDLLALIRPGSIDTAVDLGCGAGELTVDAADRLGIASITGVDSSPAMLAAAAANARPGVRFVEGDLATWTSGADHQLVIASASLHWVPDHADVLARWRAALSAGGQIAVQVPANADAHAQLVAIEVAARPHFADAFGAGGPPADPVAVNVLSAVEYSTILHRLGFTEQHVRLQIYPHLLDNSRAVVQWVKGSTLVRFEKALPPDAYAQFLAEFEDEWIRQVGEVVPWFFPFKRILMWGRLPG